MRVTTALSIALLAFSTAALAQVASAPVEQKVTPNNGTPGALPAVAPGNEVSPASPAVAATTNETREDALANSTLISNEADAR